MAFRGSGTVRHVLTHAAQVLSIANPRKVPPILPQWPTAHLSGTLRDGLSRLHLYPPARLVQLVTSSGMEGPRILNSFARAMQLLTSQLQIKVNTMSVIADEHISTFKRSFQPEACAAAFLPHIKQSSLLPQLNSSTFSPLTCNFFYHYAFREKRLSAPRACNPLRYGICESFWFN